MNDNETSRTAWETDSSLAAMMEKAWFAFFAKHGRLTGVQRTAMPLLMDGSDVLVCAATASGKTEAACAPLVERLLRGGKTGTILYITPTRALVNDLHSRLEGPAEALGLSLHRRTGEYHSSWTTPPNILLTTPESVDSMLCRGALQDERIGHLLARVEAVVLDEVHLLYGSPRGEQVKWLLARLRRLRAEAVKKGWYKHDRIQIVGLSATIADPDAVLSMYLPGGKLIVVSGSRTLELGHAESNGLEMAAGRPLKEHLLSYVESLDAAEKILVFSGSRKRVDELAAFFRDELSGQGYEVAAHHASLSKSLREEAENTVRTRKKVVLFATSTLEIGVDIGDIDIVFLDGPPPDISSFLQRIGRGNRRSGKTRVYLCSEDLKSQLLQDAMLQAARAGNMLSKPPGKQYAVIRQQIASYLYQSPKRRRGHEGIEQLFLSSVPGEKLRSLLNEMVHHGELLESPQGFRLGANWLEMASKGSIHANIEGTGGFDVIDELSGERLAQGVVLRGGKGVQVGGRNMQIQRLTDYALEVKQQVKGSFGPDGYGYAIGPAVKSDAHALALREFLGIPETLWPVLNIGGKVYVFHLGGPRRAAFLRLAHDFALPGQSLKVNEFWFCSETMNEHFFREGRVHVYQLQEMAHARIDSLERTLGRPMANKLLPKALRVEEALSWIRVDDELKQASLASWESHGSINVLSHFV